MNQSWSKLVESIREEPRTSRTGRGNGEVQVWNVRQALELEQGPRMRAKQSIRTVAEGLLAGLGVARSTVEPERSQEEGSQEERFAAATAAEVMELEEQLALMREAFSGYSHDRHEEVHAIVSHLPPLSARVLTLPLSHGGNGAHPGRRKSHARDDHPRQEPPRDAGISR